MPPGTIVTKKRVLQVTLSTPTISKKKDGKSTEKEQTMVKGENDQLSESDNKE